MIDSIPLTRDLVLVGGGHTHALFLRKWGMKPLAGARLTLIDPLIATAYTGMLPGFIAGHYEREELDIDLFRLAQHAGARFVKGAVVDIDTGSKSVIVPGRPPIFYDFLSIDVGIHSRAEGLSQGVSALKPLTTFAEDWARELDVWQKRRSSMRIVIIGGGVGGAEIALAMEHRLRDSGFNNYNITIVERNAAILSGVSAAGARNVKKALRKAGIDWKTGVTFQKVSPDQVVLTDGVVIDADFVISAVGARPHAWISQSGLETTGGYISVDKFLRSVSHPDVFATGDCAHMTESPREKAGVFAVRQAPALLNNIRAAFGVGRMRKFKPQTNYMKLVSTGGKSAIGLSYGLAVGGDWVWRWKDTIDRRFMDRLNRLPKMPRKEPPKHAAAGVRDLMLDRPLCGGCGAKLEQGLLLETLRSSDGMGTDFLDDDAAIQRVGNGFQVLSTDHLRQFVDDPWLFGRIAAIHALGDVWAMGADPQSALASIILPPMAGRLQKRTLSEVLDAAQTTLSDAGAKLVGGHTSNGAEMTIGFTVTGLTRQPPISLNKVQPGDKFVLTKPIGSGVILAAAMANETSGAHIISALDWMTEAQSEQSRLLARHARAMTDVTGFGFAGHLANIARASGVGVDVYSEAVPLMNGAQELSERGWQSSLWKANAEAVRDVLETSESSELPSPLMFDPQTAGGLLAAIPAESVFEIEETFRTKNLPISVVGRANDRNTSVRFLR